MLTRRSFPTERHVFFQREGEVVDEDEGSKFVVVTGGFGSMLDFTAEEGSLVTAVFVDVAA
jgi:hypothetical protein